MRLQSYAHGEWVDRDRPGDRAVPRGDGREDRGGDQRGPRLQGHAGVRPHGSAARSSGAMTFHERARMLKAMAQYLMAGKEEFYQRLGGDRAPRKRRFLGRHRGRHRHLLRLRQPGAPRVPRTRPSTSTVRWSRCRRAARFVGRHICVPLEGVAVHINAFNFPCWGMLEKLAPTFLAGMPAIVKPATVTSFLTEADGRAAMIESGILPEGALQLICGSAGDLLDHLTCQDVVTFTGSCDDRTDAQESARAMIGELGRASTRRPTRSTSRCSAPMPTPGTEEFDLFVKEVVRGDDGRRRGRSAPPSAARSCPRRMIDDVIRALSKRLGGVKVGDPSVDGVRMGPLAGRAQVGEVRRERRRLHRRVVRAGVRRSGELRRRRRRRERRAHSSRTLLYYCDAPFGVDGSRTTSRRSGR